MSGLWCHVVHRWRHWDCKLWDIPPEVGIAVYAFCRKCQKRRV